MICYELLFVYTELEIYTVICYELLFMYTELEIYTVICYELLFVLALSWALYKPEQGSTAERQMSRGVTMHPLWVLYLGIEYLCLQ